MTPLALAPHAARVALATALRGQEDARYLASLDAYLYAEGIRHFKAKEVCPVGRLHGALRLQAAPVDIWPNIIPTLRAAEWLRGELGDRPVKVNSGFRDPAFNLQVGGKPNSLHKYFNALDITVAGVTPNDVADALERYPMAGEMGIGTYPTQGFVHLDTRGFLGMPKARW